MDASAFDTYIASRAFRRRMRRVEARIARGDAFTLQSLARALDIPAAVLAGGFRSALARGGTPTFRTAGDRALYAAISTETLGRAVHVAAPSLQHQ